MRHRASGHPVTGRGRLTALATLALASAISAPVPASAERIENQVAVFAALDKVTARISKLEVPINQTVEFGSLKVTPRACYTRAPTEPPKTTTFVEVDDTDLDGSIKRIFNGWMFAESPGLNGVEHPVFDVWLTGCETGTKSAKADDGSAQKPDATPEPPPQRRARRRVRR